MWAVSAVPERTLKDVDGHDAAGSVVGSGCCGIAADSHGTGRTCTEPVKSLLLSQRSYGRSGLDGNSNPQSPSPVAARRRRSASADASEPAERVRATNKELAAPDTAVNLVENARHWLVTDD